MSTRPVELRTVVRAAGCVAALLVAAPLAAEPVELPPNPALGDFLRVAEARHPGLAAARAAWRADAARSGTAGSFPDPQLSAGWFVESVETRVGPQESRLSLRQRLPWFGKLGLRRDAAARGAEASRARLDDRRLALRRDVAVAWFDLWWSARALEVARENLALLDDLARVALEAYRVGRAEHADLARLQVELGRAEDLARTREDALRPIRARLDALLHRASDPPIPLPEALPALPAAPEGATVLAGLAESAPRVRERDRETEQAALGLDAARRDRWPDWTVGVEWVRTGDALDPTMEDSGKDPVIVSFAVDVPLFRGKHDAPVREAQERLLAAEQRRAEQEDVLSARVEEILFRWRDAERRSALYAEVLLPKAREALDATTAGYRTGTSRFLDVIDAQRTLLEMELEEARALADRGRSAAELEAVTGRPWIPGGAS